MGRSLYGTAYKFSKKFFTGWVIVSLLWAFFSFFSVTLYPIVEGRHLLWLWAKELVGKGTAGRGEWADGFDHHRRKQHDDESAGSNEVSKSNILETTKPAEEGEIKR